MLAQLLAIPGANAKHHAASPSSLPNAHNTTHSTTQTYPKLHSSVEKQIPKPSVASHPHTVDNTQQAPHQTAITYKKPMPTCPAPKPILTLANCPAEAVAQLTQKLMNKLILSDSTITYYQQHTNLLTDDKKRLADFIGQAAAASQDLFCELSMLAASDTFTLSLSADDKYLDGFVAGEFVPKTNQLIMPCGISAKNFYHSFYTFIHECHHTFIGNTNKKHGFFSQQNQSYKANLELPFGTHINDVAQQAVAFEKILTDGRKRVEKYIRWFHMPKDALKRKQQLKIIHLNRLAKGYIPQQRTIHLSVSQVENFIAQGHIKADLSIAKAGFQVNYGNTILNLQSIKPSPDKKSYRAYYIHSPIDASDGEKLLLDLFALTNHAYTVHDPNTLLNTEYPNDHFIHPYDEVRQYIVLFEADTYIQTPLKLYPEIFEILFPGLREWHKTRYTDEHQACLASFNPAAGL